MPIYKSPLAQAQSMAKPKKMTYLDARDKIYELRKQGVLLDDLFGTIDDWVSKGEFEDIDENKILDLKDIAMQPLEDD